MLGLSWILATHPDSAVRETREALKLAQRASELTNHQNPATLDALAVAYAAESRFDLAVRTAQDALALATQARSVDLAKKINHRLELFKQAEPYREPR